MKVDAIIFDKDGTLIDFDAFWVAVAKKAVEDALDILGAKIRPVDEILLAFGVKDGVTDMDGALCKGTYREICQIAHSVLSSFGENFSSEQVEKVLVDTFNASVDVGVIKPTCDRLKDTLITLKNQGKRLAVVTTDNEYITVKCLKALGVYDLFDKIYTDDGDLPPKPMPDAALSFMKEFNLDKNKVAMVGDTMTDVRFAKNAGIKVIGVAKTKLNRNALTPLADTVIDAISELGGVIE